MGTFQDDQEKFATAQAELVAAVKQELEWLGSRVAKVLNRLYDFFART